MRIAHPRHASIGQRLALGILLCFLLASAACKQEQRTSVESLDQAGMWSNNVAELRTLNVSNAEIGELQKAHDLREPDAS